MRIAVVGAGIAGLVAARELARRHEVWLFERAARAGGHAYTVDLDEPGVGSFPVDLGFLVYNERNYPTLVQLFDELGVETAPSSMGFAVHDPTSGFVVSGDRLGALLARRQNLVDPRFWAIVRGQLRFARAGRREIAAESLRSLGEFAARERLPREFVRLYLQPMAAAIWSMSEGDVLDFPASTLLRFFDNHGLLTLRDRPAWRTVRGGSRSYVDKLLEALPARVELGSAVDRVERAAGGVRLFVRGEPMAFDSAVLALHADQALALLVEPTAMEREVLGAIRFRTNEAVLHDDERMLPPPSARASWNVRLGAAGAGVPITYWLNRLQPLPTRRPWCVTLNRSDEIDPACIRHRVAFAHPQFDRQAIAAQARWAEIDGGGGVHFAGAYWRYGFHEDGAWSGRRAAHAVEASGSTALA